MLLAASSQETVFNIQQCLNDLKLLSHSKNVIHLCLYTDQIPWVNMANTLMKLMPKLHALTQLSLKCAKYVHISGCHASSR